MTALDLTKTPSFRLDGKRALVTGGGRGIGLAAASALAAAGAQVTLAARTRSEIEQAAAAIRERGDTAEALVLDVTDVEDRKSTRLNSSHPSISYAVFCLKKKKKKQNTQSHHVRTETQ